MSDMGCCGGSSSGPSHASFAAVPPPSGGGHAVGNWQVTKRDGSTSYYADQIRAFAEADVNGGSVQWVDVVPGTLTETP